LRPSGQLPKLNSPSRILFITQDGCPACDLSRRVFRKYLGNGITEVSLSDLPEELTRKIWGDETPKTPHFAVVLPDGEVLHAWSAIPEPEQLLTDSCALCGTEENLERCNICGGIYLCPRCRRRYFRRGLASLSYWLRGYWRDDHGLRRRR